RLNFQFGRLSSFSDGVFAIAITLLIIEIKVPVLHRATNEALLHSLSEMSLKFFGFIISFAIVGHYWSVHHRIFGYIERYNTRFIWINLAYLCSVVFLPFSSGMMGEYSSDLHLYVPYAVYVFNICLTGLMNLWLWLYISNPKKLYLTHNLSKARRRLGVYRSLVIPVVFIISLLVSFLNPVVSRFIPLVIPVILHWGLKGTEKMATAEETIDESVVTPV
ncbi:MAG: TMEM175 family protein, partial [Flavitalea sp.]